MLRRILAFVVAATTMVVLGSAVHSFIVQQAWSLAAGRAGGTTAVAIPLVDRLFWAAHDLFGMGPPYAAVTSLALAIAFLAAGALARVSGHRGIVFGVAGATAIFALFTALRKLLGTVGIFGARGALGLAAQMTAGLIAGLIFAHLTGRWGTSCKSSERADR